MTRLRQIAMAATGCFSLMVGMAGCMPNRPDEISPNAVMETSGRSDTDLERDFHRKTDRL